MTLPHIDLSPQIDVDDRVFKRFLRFPVAREFEGAVGENAAWTREWYAQNGRPWLVTIEADETIQHLCSDIWPEALNLGVIIASAGAEAELAAAEHWENDEPDRYYFLECFASAIVDELLTQTRNRLGASKHYCPGYPDWSIAANIPLLAAIKNVTDLPHALETLDSGMLTPKKSQIAVCELPAA